MKRETTTSKPSRKARAAARRLVSAVDRMIAAAKEAERARARLLGNEKGRRDD